MSATVVGDVPYDSPGQLGPRDAGEDEQQRNGIEDEVCPVGTIGVALFCLDPGYRQHHCGYQHHQRMFEDVEAMDAILHCESKSLKYLFRLSTILRWVVL